MLLRAAVRPVFSLARNTLYTLMLVVMLVSKERLCTNVTKRKTEKDSETLPVIAGGFRGAIHRRRARVVIVSILIALALFIGLWAYQLFRSLNPTVADGTTYDAESLDTNYLVLDEARIAYVFKQNTGLDINNLRKQRLYSSADFQGDFTKAYEAARALTGLRERTKAYQVYRVAESLVKHDDVYAAADFYMDFARVSLETNKPDEVRRLTQKATDMIDKSKLSDDEKVSLKRAFKNMRGSVE